MIIVDYSEECKIVDVICCHIEFKRAITLFITAVTIACDQMLPVIWSQYFLRDLRIELESIWHGVLRLSSHFSVVVCTFLRWTGLDNYLWVLLS